MTTRDSVEEQFSPESITSGCTGPRQCLASSLSAGWTSLLVQRFESPSNVEPFETLATPDQLVVVRIKGRCTIESFSNGFWKRAAFQPGLVGMTASGCTNRLRWQSQTPSSQESIHIHIPQGFFDDAEDEYRRAGMQPRVQILDVLSFYDPVVCRVACSLVDAIEGGAPNLYAQSAAQFLATHLLAARSGWPDPLQDKRRSETLSKRRLAHVLEYIDIHYVDALTLDQLAQEAGVSRFHFGRLFKENLGVTPHQHIVNVRMNAATALLAETQISVLEVALACGFQSAAHFTAAFQKHFSQTPQFMSPGSSG